MYNSSGSNFLATWLIPSPGSSPGRPHVLAAAQTPPRQTRPCKLRGVMWTYGVTIWATAPPEVWDHPTDQPAVEGSIVDLY